MKTRFILSALAVLAIAAFGSPVLAQTDDVGGAGYRVGGFLDENGDGFNDLAPDADGDGIPNGIDPDYTPPMDGSGCRLSIEDGAGDDGFIYRNNFQWKHKLQTSGFGPGDGTGNGGTGPGDGTGFGPGDGTCIPQLDGNGAQGNI